MTTSSGLRFARPQLTEGSRPLIDLAIITAMLTYDRVAQRLAGPAVTVAAPRYAGQT